MTETSERQLRPGLWETVNERYPGSMIVKDDLVPLAPLKKPLSECRLGFVSTSGVQPRDSMPFDTVHPVGDYTFREVPTDIAADQLEIHQLKYLTRGAHKDLNCVFPLDRLRELVADGVLGALASRFFTFIGYNMDPERLERTLAEELADAVQREEVDAVLAAPA